jgi:D-alanyl-D-alanine endopeptidase (penicillin-binding protein 7)
MKLRDFLALTFGLMAAGHATAAGPTAPAAGYAGTYAQSGDLELNSLSVMVYDQYSGEALYAKNPNLQTPIASITKLMTAMVTLDAKLPLDERIKISAQDIDRLKGTGSRLAVGATYTREQLLNLALIASENRAAHALGRTYPGGREAFIEAMNRKARELGMQKTLYVDPSGLSSFNQSTAEDLVKLVDHAYSYYPDIRHISTSGEYSLGKQRVVLRKGKGKRRHASRRVYYRNVAFVNTNRLTRDDDWQIGLSKTGYINEAGHCLVMQADIAERKVIIVLLDALGKYSRLGDANRIKRWLESPEASRHTQLSAPVSRGT